MNAQTLRGIYQHVNVHSAPAAKTQILNERDNQYIRIIKMFALSQTGFSIIRSRISLHTHTHVEISQRRPVNSHMTRDCETITNECVAPYVSLVIDILVVSKENTFSEFLYNHYQFKLRIPVACAGIPPV